MSATTTDAPGVGDPGDQSEDAVAAEPVTVPADGVPDVVRTREDLDEATRALASGTGPLAVDTERAQGFRYTAKAYLIQLRRAGAGTVLVDPTAFEEGAVRADLSELGRAVADAEWIIHAASQDLPCLAEVGLVPRRLFDTELAGRLLGLPRVSLGALTERALGKSLAKEHSAADWSKRPLPLGWLSYAALDVELLVELRAWETDQLDAAGKADWAAQEFAHLAEHAADPVLRRAEPWRRTAGVHDVRTPRGLAVVRELWLTRDDIAARLDKAPGRVLGDRAISELAIKAEAAASPVLGREGLRAVSGFSWRQASRFEAEWLAALERAAALPRTDLPVTRPPLAGPPAPRQWGRRFPEAFARWERVRPATVALAEELNLPVENLIGPEAVRRLAWEPPAEISTEAVDAALAASGARAWQRDLVVPVVTPLLPAPE